MHIRRRIGRIREDAQRAFLLGRSSGPIELKLTYDGSQPLPEVRFNGAIETVDDALSEQLLAVLREALSNVARHARASNVEVRVDVGDELTLVVIDDGVGVPTDAVVGGGTVNLRQRAEALGGTATVDSAEPRGTVVRWSVPTG